MLFHSSRTENSPVLKTGWGIRCNCWAESRNLLRHFRVFMIARYKTKQCHITAIIEYCSANKDKHCIVKDLGALSYDCMQAQKSLLVAN